jgi:signal transduction histidine kinase
MGSEPSDRPLRILHIEDSLADHQLARIALQRGGLDCAIEHIDTLEALQPLDAAQFDLVLADYRLPGFTALDAWEHVARQPRHPPFVLLSGAIGEAAAVDAMRLGIADYLLKDDIARLPHVVARAIEVHEARRAREAAVAELAASERRLADLTEHLQRSIEAERAAIAREIHDDIGGALTAVKFDLAWIGRHAPQGAGDGIREHAAAAVEMLQHAIGASQRIMMNLRPPVLDQGLVAAVRWLAEGFERRTGVPVQVHSSAPVIATPDDVQLVAYRTAQEALTNAAKYAQARQVRIELSDHEGVLTVEVADNGVGLAAEARAKPKAFGLKGLQERARTVGGWLDVSSRPGRGTSIIVSIPLPSPDTTEKESAP